MQLATGGEVDLQGQADVIVLPGVVAVLLRSTHLSRGGIDQLVQGLHTR